MMMAETMQQISDCKGLLNLLVQRMQQLELRPEELAHIDDVLCHVASDLGGLLNPWTPPKPARRATRGHK
jgi:hypothetical protein